MDSKELNIWHLYAALQQGDVLAAQQAVESGADPDTDFAGETPLHWVVENGHQTLGRI